jgi:hypothetical protein
LPVPYFHNVFTLPHEFNPLILYSEHNQRALLKLLFDAAAKTLMQFGQSDFGGRIGFSLVLHTWDQRLNAHFHVHALIASGALSDDGSRWIAGGSQFLFPVRALSKCFRRDSPLPATRLAGSFPSHPALRVVCQLREEKVAGPLPRVTWHGAPCAGGRTAAHRRRVDETCPGHRP